MVVNGARADAKRAGQLLAGDLGRAGDHARQDFLFARGQPVEFRALAAGLLLIGKAGADFKREFTLETYRQFFADAGYSDMRFELCEGRIPCAVALIRMGVSADARRKSS